jgi:O-antigen/teichoic acid export membrane protein
MSFKRDTAWSAIAAAVAAGGRIGVMAVLARRLTHEQLGDFIFVQWILDTAFVFASVGLPGIATRFFAQYRSGGYGAFSAFEVWYRKRALIAIAVVGCIGPSIAWAATGHGALSFIAAVGAWAVGSGAWALEYARVQGLQRFRLQAAANVLFVVLALLGVIVLPAPLSVQGVMFVMGLAGSAAAALCALCADAHMDEHSISASFQEPDVEAYGKNVWLAAAFSALVWSRAEISVVRSVQSSSEVALYGAAATLSGLANLSIALLTGAVGPNLARLWGKNAKTEVVRLSRTMSDFLVVMSSLGVGFLVCFAPYLLKAGFGESYQSASLALILLALGTFGLTSACANSLMQLASNGAFIRNTNLLGAIVLFGLAIPLTMTFGFVGAAAARCVVQLLTAAITFRAVTRHYGAGAFSKSNLALSAVALAAAGLAANTLASISARLLIFTALIVAVLWSIRIGPSEERVSKWLSSKAFLRAPKSTST